MFAVLQTTQRDMFYAAACDTGDAQTHTLTLVSSSSFSHLRLHFSLLSLIMCVCEDIVTLLVSHPAP